VTRRDEAAHDEEAAHGEQATHGDEAAHRAEPEMVIPADRLPPGFAERVADPPPDAALPLPAATAVLLRDGVHGPELLLLKRLRTAGFVPGAYVFPGGRVDDADAAPPLVALLGTTPRGPEPAYWLATIREVFEETGVLLARPGRVADAEGDSDADADADADGHADTGADAGANAGELARWRDALLVGDATLLDVLRATGLRPDISGMVYCAHWITPVAEPRRFDTRFFLAELPQGCSVTVDEREMTDAVWLTPADALDLFRRGELPMVFPTVKTIQRLAPYRSVAEALAAFRGRAVAPILPRLVTTPGGIGIVLNEHDEEGQADE
jgi:8-oxo-dGTP pyrophosphatase MutT (NUDIX family)